MTVEHDAPPFRYVHSTNLPQLIHQLGAALFVSTYQAGKLVVVRERQGRISALLRSFEQAMGLAVDPRRLAVGTRNGVWRLANSPEIAAQLEPAGECDACFLPRSSHVTGDIRIHELSWAGDELWLVNTRFSCLCTLHPDYSFMPRWRPAFITEFAADDRCHLNGMEIVDGRPAYVTALGETNSPQGWRENKARGGCVIDAARDETLARGLCMPHSPRVHQGRLYVLDSGTGRLLTIDRESGRAEVVAQLPGYARGLALLGGYAFVGLSKIRETSTFGGLPIAEQLAELKCGIWIVDIASGQTAAMLEFEKGVEEIFDVRLLPGVRFPAVIGLQKETIHGAFVVPPQNPLVDGTNHRFEI